MAQWMSEQNLTQAQIGKKVGVDQVSVSRYLQGVSRPKLLTAVKLEKITKDFVRCRDWMLKGRRKYATRKLAA